MSSFNVSCDTPTTGTFLELFTSVIHIFAARQCLISEGTIEDVNIRDHSTYDFIIVGAGTAGSVLANRLTESNDWNVLLIEAGGDPPVEAEVPQMDKNMFGTKYDWQYLTTNDSIINQANINGSINWPRGKMIGGSSNLNAMIYVQGNKLDYKDWCDAGNIEWCFKDFNQYFKKAESYQNVALLADPKVYKQYGHNGPLVINVFNSTYRKVTEKILLSWDGIGVKTVPDLNAANVLGSGITAATAADGTRQSSNKAYLNTAKHRKQLTVLKNTLVTKILIKMTSKVAYGVTVLRNLKKQSYFASKEIILSAGTINSPQLLMLSGIGPKKHLISKGIKVLADLPMVGQNLQDHCIVPVMICTNETDPETALDHDFDVFKYIYNRTGFLAQNSISDILAFYSSNKSALRPDYQSHLSIIWRNSSKLERFMTQQFRYKETVTKPIVELNKNYTIFTFLFNLLHPKSRGNITLQSNNPKQHPFIYPNYFREDRDLASAATGIKILTKLLKTKYFQSVGAFLARMQWPECDKYELDSTNYWKCVCKNMVLTVYHPVGTCMMGPDPNTSVVDSRLRVHYIQNLRVCDGSVMPYITSGNTNGPITMIGERAAKLIIEDHTFDLQ